MSEWKIGDVKKFNFVPGEYEILEIINGEGLSMTWKWLDIVCPDCKKAIEICPHCDKKIGGLREHQFEKIYVFMPRNLELKGHEDKILLIGYIKDGRIMRVPIDQSYKILARSTIFKEKNN